MNQGFKKDFGDAAEYKDLFYKKVYLYVRSRTKREDTWPAEECENIAHDVTMNAITSLLEKERNGGIIQDRLPYLMKCVNNELKQKKFIFHKDARKRSVDDNDTHWLPAMVSAEWYPSLGVAVNDAIIKTQPINSIWLIDCLDVDERKVAELRNAGFNSKEIADQLGRSQSTISRIMDMIRVKLGTNKP